MRRVPVIIAFALLTLAPARAAAQWPPDSLTNLQVFPKDISIDELAPIMFSFTRALGVRCSYCHKGDPNRPISTYDFASDEKVTKKKARVMLRMVARVNDTLKTGLPEHLEPHIEVECFTCHRGVTAPRTLQSILLAAYQDGGLDSTFATYRALRERYYGRAAYDFGEVTLTDVADAIDRKGARAEAVRVHALNVEANPASAFAKRSHAELAMARAFQQGAETGAAQYRELRTAYGEGAVNERLVNTVGYRLLREHDAASAVAAFRLNTAEHPESWNVFDSLGEGLVAAGDTAGAIASYEKSLRLNPQNTAGAEQLSRLRKRR